MLFISAINYVGIRRAGNFQLAFTLLKIVLIIAIAALAFSTHGDWGHFAQRYSAAPGGIVGFTAAVTAALWAYDGWSDLNMVAEEVRAPERNIPLAMIGGMCVIASLYMLVNAAVQYALPPAQVANSASPMADAVRNSFLGLAGVVVVSCAMVISLVTTLNGVAMSGARMAFAMARDGNFFQILDKVHPRFHTPHVAILTQAGYQSWGFPLAPALFIVASAALLYYTFTSNLPYSVMGTLVILAGIPVYYMFAHRRKV